MNSDEELYKLAAQELSDSPRQGLLIKCLAESDGDENKGKALYIKTRVREMQSEFNENIKSESTQENQDLNEKSKKNNKDTYGWLGALLLVFIIIGGKYAQRSGTTAGEIVSGTIGILILGGLAWVVWQAFREERGKK